MSDSFIFLPNTLASYLFVEAIKGIKNGRKKAGIPLDSNFILGVYDSTGDYFSSLVDIVAYPDKAFEGHRQIIRGCYLLETQHVAEFGI